VRTEAALDEDDGEPSTGHQSEVLKTCHWEISDYDINDEKKLHRLATRGGTYIYMYTI